MKYLSFPLLLTFLLFIPLASGSYAPVCNSTEVGDTSCGGYNMQMVLTCANESGVYDWNTSQTFCPYGCYQGSCVSFTTPCTNYCSPGSTKCVDSSYFVYCNLSSGSSCYDWSYVNKQYCQHGCVSGNCTPALSYCSYGEYDCVDQYLMNCTKNQYNVWVWNRTSFCTYGCAFNYSSGNVIGAYCLQVGDAHGVVSSISQGSRQLNFIFAPVLFLAFIIVSLLISGYFVYKTHNSTIGFLTFSFFLLIGTYYAVVPLFITLTCFIIFLVVKGYGVFHD